MTIAAGAAAELVSHGKSYRFYVFAMRLVYDVTDIITKKNQLTCQHHTSYNSWQNVRYIKSIFLAILPRLSISEINVLPNKKQKQMKRRKYGLHLEIQPKFWPKLDLAGYLKIAAI